MPPATGIFLEKHLFRMSSIVMSFGRRRQQGLPCRLKTKLIWCRCFRFAAYCLRQGTQTNPRDCQQANWVVDGTRDAPCAVPMWYLIAVQQLHRKKMIQCMKTCWLRNRWSKVVETKRRLLFMLNFSPRKPVIRTVIRHLEKHLMKFKWCWMR